MGVRTSCCVRLARTVLALHPQSLFRIGRSTGIDNGNGPRVPEVLGAWIWLRRLRRRVDTGSYKSPFFFGVWRSSRTLSAYVTCSHLSGSAVSCSPFICLGLAIAFRKDCDVRRDLMSVTFAAQACPTKLGCYTVDAPV